MKKVLASVLAGSMVLGMASMASASTLSLKLKDSKNTEFDYSLYLYEPDGTVVSSAWDVDKPVEFDEAITEYQKLVKEVSKYGEDDIKGGSYSIGKFKKLVQARDAVYGALLASERTNADMDGAVDFGMTKYATVDVAGVINYALMWGVVQGVTGTTNKTWSPAAWDLDALKQTATGTGEYRMENKSRVDITDSPFEHHMYTYGLDNVKEVKFEIVVQYDEDFRVDVTDGDVKVSKKRVAHDKAADTDTYQVIVKANAGVRAFELADWTVELDLQDANKVYFIEGDVAYSDYREVEPDERYIINKSDKNEEHDDGSIFNFNQTIDEETRIVCNDYVDVLFKGNYGTDFENMKVETSNITEVEEFFQDYDIDYYDFIGNPKFAKDVTVRIDADFEAFIYEYDKNTGDVVDISEECEYDSDGKTFKRKNLKTYVILEEPYEGGNVKAVKEPVAEEPDDTDEVEEPKDDPSSEGSKPNPGTGAYPLF